MSWARCATVAAAVGAMLLSSPSRAAGQAAVQVVPVMGNASLAAGWAADVWQASLVLPVVVAAAAAGRVVMEIDFAEHYSYARFTGTAIPGIILVQLSMATVRRTHRS